MKKIKEIIDGSFLTEKYVIKQSKLLVMIVILFIIFISNDYACRKKLTQIEDLKIILKDVQYENLLITKELTSSSRRSQIEELLNTRGIKLSSSTNPAFEIRK